MDFFRGEKRFAAKIRSGDPSARIVTVAMSRAAEECDPNSILMNAGMRRNLQVDVGDTVLVNTCEVKESDNAVPGIHCVSCAGFETWQTCALPTIPVVDSGCGTGIRGFRQQP